MDIKDIEVTQNYKDVLGFLDAGVPAIFISGKAGTGKSTLIKWLQSGILKKNIVTVAPTGVAALNIGDATTIHSFFRFPPRFILPEDIKQVYDRVYKKMDILIIDESSMLRSDMCDGIDLFLKKNGPDESRPFGGVQVIFVGDLYQLPPIVSPSEKNLFLKYSTPFFFSADVFKDIKLTHIELDKIYRQSDTGFTDILNNLRVGEHIAESLGKINQLCVKPKPENELCVTLATTNAIADEVNHYEMNRLPGETFTFIGEINGNIKENNLPVPMILKLKAGARVMFVRNDPEKRYCNGTVGIVDTIDKKHIKVKLSDGEILSVEKAEWGNYRFDTGDDGRVIPKRSGSYVQIPLILGWSITIHRSQSKTLESIFLDTGTGSGAFAPGQIYVGLSRCTTIEGLHLKRPIRVSEIKVDARITAFFKSLNQKDLSHIL